MIVVHNNVKPKEVSPLVNSTIVDSDGGIPKNYNAYSVKSTVTWPDPAAYNEAATSDVNKLRDARNDVVNHAKVPDIAIGTPSSRLLNYVSKSGETNLLITSPFGNWREYSTNGFCTISERVLLSPSELKMTNGVSYNVGDFKDLINGSKAGKMGNLLDTLKGASVYLNAMAEVSGDIGNSIGGFVGKDYNWGFAAAEKGEYISKFMNMPVVNPAATTTSGISSLTFTFKFGQAQLFSAEEEVVKPILALANIFMPRQSGSSNRITTPFMSEIRAKTHMAAACLGLGINKLSGLLGDITDVPTGSDIVKNGLGAIGDAAKGVIENGKKGGFMGVANGLLKSLNDVTSEVFEGIDKAAMKALDETVTILVNLGGYVTGPYVASSVNWDFDFNNVDEYGYPCQGSITLGGLKMLFINCADDVLRQWGYNVDGTGDNPFGESTLNNTLRASFGSDSPLVGTSTGNQES